MEIPKPVKPDDIETRGLVWRPRKKRWTAYWLPRPDLIAERGFPIKSRILWPPSSRPEAIPERGDWEDLQVACNKLQNEMLAWGRPDSGRYDPHAMFDGTFDTLFTIYLHDPNSPYKKLRFKTAKSYESRIEYLRSEIGRERISFSVDATGRELSKPDFRDFEAWHERWLDPEGQNRVSHAHTSMKHLRLALKFGALVRLNGCREACETLKGLRFKVPKRRTQIVTSEQAVLIRQGAHEIGRPSIALAEAFQHGLLLRQKDVLGETIPREYPGITDILLGTMKHVGGLRWEKLNQGFQLEHTISKSLRGRQALARPEDTGDVKRWNLWLYPPIIEELCLMAGVTRANLRRDLFPASGLIVVAEHNRRPWVTSTFTDLWREIARAKGIPDEVQNRDSRAGGATDAEQKGADLTRRKAAEEIRPALGHKQATTSVIYLRDDDEATAHIARIRYGTGGQDGQ